MRKAFVALAAVALLTVSASAQDNGRGQTGSTMVKGLGSEAATCTFADGKQLTVRYKRTAVDRKEDLPIGKLWPSNGSAMFLFTPVGLTIGGVEIPAGAFSLYIIPGNDDWTLIVNKNVDESAKYDEAQDLLRTPIKTGELGSPAEEFKVYFGHIAPKQCNMRLYYGRTGAWAEFRER
jgi:Protein of unknown function (DUF2911)